MGMQIIKRVREITKLTNYGISKALRENGIEITTQGIDSYEKETARSMRLDVLSGLLELCIAKGLTDKKALGLIRDEAKRLLKLA